MQTIVHGSHNSYSRGCRCDECRAAHRDYEREAKRRRARPDGPGKMEMCESHEVRVHLTKLAAKGLGVRRISAHTGVSIYTLQNIRNGNTRLVTKRVNDILLAVNTLTLPPVKQPHPDWADGKVRRVRRSTKKRN